MVLYHASNKNNLKLITPQPTLSNNALIGNYVFATSNMLLAKMYLANNGVPILMDPDETFPTIVFCCDAKSYIKNDRGGTIYEMDDKTFTESPQKELSSYEMVSAEPVTPHAQKTYKKSLDAINESGINIYFVSEADFNNLIKNPRQKDIIKLLTPYY